MFDIFFFRNKPNLFPHEQKIENIDQAIQLCKTRYFWIINSQIDYSDFDFDWEPPPWEANQKHVWPSYSQTDSQTWLVPVTGFDQTNFHVKQKLPAHNSLVYIIDHGNGQLNCLEELLSRKFQKVEKIKYIDNYLDVIKKIIHKAHSKYHFTWVVSSICDYTDFDFNWLPAIDNLDAIHVFPSNEQKLGDTFFLDIDYVYNTVDSTARLTDFNLQFVEQSVPRLPVPLIVHNQDSHVNAVLETELSAPVVLFSTTQSIVDHPTLSFWTPYNQYVTPLSKSGSTMLFVRSAAAYINTQIYDYPYIDFNKQYIKDRPLDVVFISNGEPNAEQNYQHLCRQLSGKPNRCIRINNVNGRVNAYHAAMNASETNWAFCVFAKLQVNENFDWGWQPDYLQRPKHYIFHARNPVNGLEYGHQALIAYNKNLALCNQGTGLDFTLDQPHAVVPILSGTAQFHLDKWTTWRTAFREVLKLKNNSQDSDSQFRLEKWATIDLLDNEISHYAILGAADAIEYFDLVQGDHQKLQLSYEWSWLADYAVNKIHRLDSQDIIF